MKELILVNGQSYSWKSLEMYDRLMGCYSDETGFYNKSSQHLKFLAVLYAASPEAIVPTQKLAENFFGVFDHSTRQIIHEAIWRIRKLIDQSNLRDQIAIYNAAGQGYALLPKLVDGEMISLSDQDGQSRKFFARGNSLV